MSDRGAGQGQRRRRWPGVAVVMGSAGSAAVATSSFAVGGVAPTGCTSIANVPVAQSIQYVAAIQNGIFHDFNGMGNGCADCHTAADGGIPAGNLDLDYLDTPSPYVNLVNVG